MCEKFFWFGVKIAARRRRRFLFPNRSLVVVGFGFGLRGARSAENSVSFFSPDFSSSLLSSAGAAGSHGYHIEAKYNLMVSGIPSQKKKGGGTGVCSCS